MWLLFPLSPLCISQDVTCPPPCPAPGNKNVVMIAETDPNCLNSRSAYHRTTLKLICISCIELATFSMHVVFTSFSGRRIATTTCLRHQSSSYMNGDIAHICCISSIRRYGSLHKDDAERHIRQIKSSGDAVHNRSPLLRLAHCV